MEVFGRFVDRPGGAYVPGVDTGTHIDDLALIGKVAPDVSCGHVDPSPYTARGVLAPIQAAADTDADRAGAVADESGGAPPVPHRRRCGERRPRPPPARPAARRAGHPLHPRLRGQRRVCRADPGRQCRLGRGRDRGSRARDRRAGPDEAGTRVGRRLHATRDSRADRLGAHRQVGAHPRLSGRTPAGSPPPGAHEPPLVLLALSEERRRECRVHGHAHGVRHEAHLKSRECGRWC